jgi:hypothetical protein
MGRRAEVEKMKKVCKVLAAPSLLLCLLAVVGIAGAIENGGSLSLCWWAFGCIGATYAIIRTAAKG